MIKKFFSDRLNILKLICVVILISMVFRLADLQIVKGDYYRVKSETIRTRNINVTAPRGNIVDKYGRIIADNKLSYSVEVMKTNVSEEKLNDIALSIVNILEQNDDKYKDDIPILTNPIRFTFYEQEILWKKKYNISDNATGKQAFERLKADYNIPAGTIDVEAYTLLTEEYKVELPFNINDFVFTFKKDELKWKQKYGFDENSSAVDILVTLLEKYDIPIEKYGYENGKKILAIKYMIKQNKYKAYEPVEIAVNVSEKTRAQIEENKIFLDGVQINEKPMRRYINAEFACHIIGYMGKMGSELEEMLQKGYQPSDVIGKSGIELTMEEYLKGQDGSKQIEVDASGSLIDNIDMTDPIPGDTVFLTIDSKLQRISEEALKNTMDIAKKKGETKSRNGVVPPNIAVSGAVVAIDVNTGEVLALASEPKYDPNIFATGISFEDWESLKPESDDRYAPKPLINNVISTPMPPGSTMKMLTGIAALTEQKISPTDNIYCKGKYTTIPGVAPTDAHGAVHGAQNTVQAIMNSCNYYFFELGRRLGGELFEQYAKKFGFGEITGIELPFENRGNIQGPEHKKDLYKQYLDRYLQYSLKIEDKNIRNEICSYIYNYKSNYYSELKSRLKELGITNKDSINRISDYIRESTWKPGDVLNSAIGQGMNNVTPLQLANYIATVANGGTRYKPHLVKKIIAIDGTVKLEKQPEIIEKIDIPMNVHKTILDGMYNVINGPSGTARGLMNGTDILAGGKTGTAEAGKYKYIWSNGNITYEKYDDHSWFVAFAPYDKPQIAVAVVVHQGGYGSTAAPVAREIIKQYLTPNDVFDTILEINSLLP